MTLRESIAPCLKRPNLRRTFRIALVVGCVLTAINQLDVILAGDATALTGVKIGLNFCVPFIVSNLGVIAATRTAREPEVPEADAQARPL
jgi:hypothetical protein